MILRSRALVVVAVALAVTLAACSSAESATPSAVASAASSTPGAGSPAASPAPAAGGWAPVATSGTAPAAREDHTWTIAPDGATAYLFGGRDGTTVFDDLWAYSLATDAWTAVTPSGAMPRARFGHNAVWTPGIGLVVFGGQGEAGFFGDLWAYDPAANAWRSLPSNGAAPVPRYGSCGSIGPDGRLWISHGFTSDGRRFADTRAYDFPTGDWTDETPVGDAPIPRCLHACWWTEDGALILYGGQTTGTTALGDQWRLTRGERPGTNAWNQLLPTGEAPAARNLYAAARWGAGALVFGGQALDGTYLADTWWLADDASILPVAAGDPAPSARSGAELVADGGRERLLVFGGRDGAAALDDLWQLVAPPLP